MLAVDANPYPFTSGGPKGCGEVGIVRAGPVPIFTENGVFYLLLATYPG